MERYIYKFRYFALILICLAFGCKKVLDKENLSVITGNDVWKDKVLLNAYINQLYVDFAAVCDWNTSAPSWSDEAGPGTNAITYGTDLTYGRITPDNNSLEFWPYASIRRMNTFFANIESSPLDPTYKNTAKGQVYFLRAFNYFEMVKRYGGVPILTEAQELTQDLFVPRNKTSECFTFILKDLDNAIAMLPDTYDAIDQGRITKSAAYAFKSRVLLFRASPQFNPTKNQALWDEANAATKSALDYLNTQGHGLFTTGNDPYRQLWYNELNKEDLLVLRHNYPEWPSYREASVRPLSESFNNAESSQPTQELVESYPMANGLSILDPASGYNATNYWVGRDPRFYATVVYNGARYALGGNVNRIQYTYLGSFDNGGQGDGFGLDYGTSTGYYSRKAIDTALTRPEAYNSGIDWVEIRYAEVMLNYAETANATGNSTEAYNMLKTLRARAGITPGANNLYGLTPAMNTDAMLEAIMRERFIELSFENKRFWDLRRQRWLNRLDGKYRHALVSTLKVPGNVSAGFDTHIENADKLSILIMPDKYYFFPINRVQLRNNPKLIQNKGWEDGTFDPLQ